MKKYISDNKISLPCFFGHLFTIIKHKHYVLCGCIKTGIIWQGLTHDLSKFSPAEFIPGVIFFTGTKSPNALERQYKGYSAAWLHHKGINKHHFEYWIDYSLLERGKLEGCRMPLKYVVEMVCDRIAACKAYHKSDYTQKDPWEYYILSRQSMVIHKDTKAVLEKALYIMNCQGEKACFSYLKSLLKITKGNNYTAEMLGLNYEPPD